ncbi:hypothetical protein D3OALGA1CA_4222 [Olavius algarvensis associated proteobacterium Delta 3]|nr:hypothetical protein D3OALGB2SA_4274 [Olavius algarvensis associated proteobacterium Delta 3]CAB5147462.1 hypothetical protein D3OALGA1CA_4222 [Olavius algarvensis associated proteobacterium Delta 3]
MVNRCRLTDEVIASFGRATKCILIGNPGSEKSRIESVPDILEG